MFDPATGTPRAALTLALPAELDRALDAADRGGREWRTTTPDQRGAILGEAAQARARSPRPRARPAISRPCGT